MVDKTSVTVDVHMKGPSKYHCDQSGDSATIVLGEGFRAALHGSTKDFLMLAEVCMEAARRIAAKGLVKEEEATNV